MQPSINTPDRQAEAFPVLTPAQIDRIRPYGTVRTVRGGEVLFEPGELGIPCFVVLSGKLEILMTRLSGEYVLVTFGPGGFSGEMVLISGARSLSRGRVAEPGEFLELSADALHSLIAKDEELSDIFPATPRPNYGRSGQRDYPGIALLGEHAALARIPNPQWTSAHLCRP